MPTINLLPWREELRQKRKKEFLVAVLFAALAAGGLTLGVNMFYSGKISYQESRNNTLRAEIELLDRQIEEIESLDAQKQSLLDRMEIIEQLERTTPEAVTLIDSMVDVVPDGTRFTRINQDGTRIAVSGAAQSNARVADLMRNVDRSEWLENADLDDVISESAQGEAVFNLTINQIRISDREE